MIFRFAVVFLFCSISALPRLIPGISSNTETVDFRAYYSASQAVESGYDPYLAFDSVGSALKPGRTKGTQYVYPPTLLAAFHTIARLPFSTQERTWLLLQIICGAVGLTILLRAVEFRLPGGQCTPLQLGIFFLLVLGPLYYNYAAGQLDVLLLPLIVFAFTKIWEKPYVAGLSLAAVLMLKHSAVFVVIPMLFINRAQFLKGLGVGVLSLFLLSLTVVDVETWWSFILLQMAGSESLVTLPPPHDVYNLGLSGVLARLDIHWSSGILLLGVIALIVVGKLGSAISRIAFQPWYYLSIVIAFLILPRLWPQHLILLLPVVLFQIADDYPKRISGLILSFLTFVFLVFVPGFILSKVLLRVGLPIDFEWLSSLITLFLLSIFIIRSFVFYKTDELKNETSYI